MVSIDEADFSLSYTSSPFTFAVSNADGSTAFNSSTSFHFGDQYLELGTSLSSSDKLFGLGEKSRSTGSVIPPGTTTTMWARDMAAAVFDTNLYASHPFFLSLSDSGAASGAFLRNSNGLDVEYSDAGDSLTFKALGGVVDQNPSYCDRVLWRSLPGAAPQMYQTLYSSAPSLNQSDHRPVLASFAMNAREPFIARGPITADGAKSGPDLLILSVTDLKFTVANETSNPKAKRAVKFDGYHGASCVCSYLIMDLCQSQHNTSLVAQCSTGEVDNDIKTAGVRGTADGENRGRKIRGTGRAYIPLPRAVVR